MPDPFDPIHITVRGPARPPELKWLGGQPVLVHYDNMPAKDITTVRGIPCTTALRTVIDLAPDVDRRHLERMVTDCLDRRLFTVEEAKARLDEDDMLTRPGTQLLRTVLGLPAVEY
jgi:hypothetical protein